MSLCRNLRHQRPEPRRRFIRHPGLHRGRTITTIITITTIFKAGGTLPPPQRRVPTLLRACEKRIACELLLLPRENP